jgi:hypothetical protein
MGEALHFYGIFRDSPETIAAVPTSIGKDMFAAFGMTIVAVSVPDMCTGAPAGKANIPFKA